MNRGHRHPTDAAGSDGQPCSPRSEDLTEEALVGVWRRTDPGDTDKGKEYLAGGPGFLGNFDAGPFDRADSFVWALDGDLVTETRASGDVFHERVVSFDGCDMVQRREEDGRDRNWSHP
ncbi:MAG: hypothetical protein HYY06_21505 [Deltaproteobacteria bacterium]|nr:hypothetical protein [Deltaproteobacteria bacterium]